MKVKVAFGASNEVGGKKRMTGPDNYQDLVAKAESAVKGVTDPELRRVAFEKILDDLLRQGSAVAPGETRRATPKPPPRPAASRKASRARGPKGYIREMVQDGFFKKPKTIAQVKAELENRGHHIALSSLSGPLQSLCQDRALRRQKAKIGKKETFSYSEW